MFCFVIEGRGESPVCLLTVGRIFCIMQRFFSPRKGKAVNFVQSLIELQDTDATIRELEREARDIPQRKAQESARLSGVEAELEIAQNQLAALMKRIEDCGREADEARERAQQLKIASATASSNKELMQQSAEIARLEADADASERRAEALEADIRSLKAAVEEAQAKVDVEKGGVDGFVKELEERFTEVKDELARLQVERREKANKVGPKYLLVYERLRTKRWPVVVRLTDGDVCDGCHLVQPPSVAQAVKHNNELVRCTMCGRILYRDL